MTQKSITDTMIWQAFACGAYYLALFVFWHVFIGFTLELTSLVFMVSRWVPFSYSIQFVNDCTITWFRTVLEWLFLQPLSISFHKANFYNCVCALEKDFIA